MVTAVQERGKSKMITIRGTTYFFAILGILAVFGFFAFELYIAKVSFVFLFLYFIAATLLMAWPLATLEEKMFEKPIRRF
jgi:Na+-transporting methylmalonyl-CoA/oxaloacetate decarboxylase gamma subunit